jgi:hypothetical protein
MEDYGSDCEGYRNAPAVYTGDDSRNPLRGLYVRSTYGYQTENKIIGKKDVRNDLPSQPMPGNLRRKIIIISVPLSITIQGDFRLRQMTGEN